MVGVSQPAIAKIESGKVKNLQLKTLVKYAATLGGQVWIQIVEDASVSGSRNGDTAKWRPAQSHRNRFRSAEDRRTLPGKIALPCRLAL
jgi:transcriptional regulator with XRE-family HTH domain